MLDHYFKQLNLDLKKQGIATPQLIVDAAALKQNIQHVQLRLSHAPHLKARLVVKSLASLDLLKLLSEQLNTQRFMVFHQPHTEPHQPPGRIGAGQRLEPGGLHRRPG